MIVYKGLMEANLWYCCNIKGPVMRNAKIGNSITAVFMAII